MKNEVQNETESIRNTNTFKRMQRCLTRSRICSLTPRLINLWMSQPRTSHEISLFNTTDHIIFLNYPIYTLHPCHSRADKNSKGKLCGSRISFSSSRESRIEIDLSSRQWEPRREVFLRFHRINLGYLFAFRSERYLNNAPPVYRS